MFVPIMKGICVMRLDGSWLPEVRAALEELAMRVAADPATYAPAGAPPFAVFDWDQTVIRHDIGDALFVYQMDHFAFALDHDDFWDVLGLQGDAALRAQVAALAARPHDVSAAAAATRRAWEAALVGGYMRASLLDPQEGFPWQTRVLTGLTPEAVHRLTREAAARELEALLGRREFSLGDEALHFHQGLRPYAEILGLMRGLEAAGIEVWVVSATNVWAVQTMGELLDLDPARVIGMRTHVVDGRITSDLDGVACATWGKVDAIRRHIHPTQRPVLAAGDNITDLPMLEYSADTRLVIDRGVAALRQAAEAQRRTGERWLIQPMFDVT